MFTGILTPSITILGDDGNFDLVAMGQHIENLIAGGVNGILFFGSIGEFFAFSPSEKKRLIDFVVPKVAKRVPVLVGIGSNMMEEVIDLAAYSKNAGVDGVVVISPFYFGPSDAAAKRFYGTIAKAVDIPMMLYNFPARTGNDLGPILVTELAMTYPNIVSIKDTVDNISHTRKIIAEVKSKRPDFSVLSGYDEYYLVNRLSGGDGVLCGLTNVEPSLFYELHKAYEAGNFATMQLCGRKLASLMRLYETTDHFISGIKAAVQAKSLRMSIGIKEPAIQANGDQIDLIRKILEETSRVG